MPDVVLDKLLYLMLPLGFQHHFFDRLYRYHEPMDVLDEYVVACDEQFLATWLLTTATALTDRLEVSCG